MATSRSKLMTSARLVEYLNIPTPVGSARLLIRARSLQVSHFTWSRAADSLARDSHRRHERPTDLIDDFLWPHDCEPKRFNAICTPAPSCLLQTIPYLQLFTEYSQLLEFCKCYWACFAEFSYFLQRFNLKSSVYRRILPRRESAGSFSALRTDRG